MNPSSPSRWIVSPKVDLLWFQGSVLAGVALMTLFRLLPGLDDANDSRLGHPALWVLFLWGVLFDGTHVWGTYARSYLASDPESRAALPGRWSWGLFALGPAIALADLLLASPSPPGFDPTGWLFRHFLLLAYLWAYWHLVRQNYGFLVLYRRKSGETSARGGRLDSAILWSTSLYPFLRFSLGPAYLANGLPALLPEAWLPAARTTLDLAFGAGLACLVALALSGRIEPLRPGPKHLFLLVVGAYPVALFAVLDHLLTITATLTIFHNLQYHRIVWQYERGRGRMPSGGLGPYLALGATLGLVWYGVRVFGAALPEAALLRNLLIGLGWGVAFHHYLVDGRIWRVRRSPDVSRTLDRGARPEAVPNSQ